MHEHPLLRENLWVFLSPRNFVQHYNNVFLTIVYYLVIAISLLVMSNCIEIVRLYLFKILRIDRLIVCLNSKIVNNKCVNHLFNEDNK